MELLICYPVKHPEKFQKLGSKNHVKDHVKLFMAFVVGFEGLAVNIHQRSNMFKKAKWNSQIRVMILLSQVGYCG